MCAARPVPAWHQIADMGFSDVVEASGYTRTGRAHWQWQGDGVIYHYRLIPGSRLEPGSFSDIDAVYYPPVHELAQKMGIFVPSYEFPNTKIPYDLGTTDDLYFWYYRAEFLRYREIYPKIPPPTGFWQVMWSFFKDPEAGRPRFTDLYMKDLKFHDVVEPGSEIEGYWLTEGEDLREVTEELCRLWAYHERLEDRHQSFAEYYEKEERERILNPMFPGLQAPYFLAAAIMGDTFVIQKIANDELSDIGRSIEEEYQHLFDHWHRFAGERHWKQRRHTELGQLELMNEAASTIAWPYRQLAKIRDWSQALNIPVDLPDLDYSIIEKSDRLHAEWQRRRDT